MAQQKDLPLSREGNGVGSAWDELMRLAYLDEPLGRNLLCEHGSVDVHRVTCYPVCNHRDAVDEHGGRL